MKIFSRIPELEKDEYYYSKEGYIIFTENTDLINQVIELFRILVPIISSIIAPSDKFNRGIQFQDVNDLKQILLRNDSILDSEIEPSNPALYLPIDEGK